MRKIIMPKRTSPHLRTLTLILLATLLAFSQQSFSAQAAPLLATALPEGRTYDQAHNTGFIDWNTEVIYENIYHRDGSSLPPEEGGASCNSGCTENVTRLHGGGIVSGSFLRDVTYFETMVAYEWVGTGVGSATLTACSVSTTTNMTKSNNSAAGFVSLILSVPAGCRDWSLSASGGHIHFRSIDALYVTPTATPTASLTPTGTLLPTNTATATAAATATATFTATSTNQPTATYTYTASPTETGTLEPTATFTATATEEPPATPWVVTVPVVIVIQEQNVEVSSGSGSLSSQAVTPTPPFSQGFAGFGGSTCTYALRTFVYVDSNDDKLMSPSEGAEGLEIVIMDQSYARLGNRYTQEGQVVFCLGSGQLGETLHVEIPYLHQAQTVNISKSLSEDVEVWFRLDQPTLPLYLP
jgi:hypothetical protein